LFAAALNPNITALIADLSDLSYRHEARKGNVADVPRVLATLDLPAIVALVAPRHCWIRCPDGTDELELRSTYEWSTEFYQRTAGTSRALRLGLAGSANWNETARWFALHLREKV
jgi:hypothetical protein